MIGNALEEFVVEFLEESGTFLSGAGTQTRRKFPLNIKMVAQAFGASGGTFGRHGRKKGRSEVYEEV
jgi:hypothetical protein